MTFSIYKYERKSLNYSYMAPSYGHYFAIVELSGKCVNNFNREYMEKVGTTKVCMKPHNEIPYSI